MKLQVRMNPKKKLVEIRTSKFTKDPSAIQKGADFVQAFICGFDVSDAIAILRVDDLYVDSFEVRDGMSTIAFIYKRVYFAGSY
jgi:RNA-binding protein PNO1